MIGAMVAYGFMTLIGFSFWVSITLAIIITAIVHIFVYKICVQYLGNLHLNLGWIITLIGAGIILDNLARVLFGSEPQVFPYLFAGMKITLFGYSILLHEIAMVAISLIICIAYQTMLQKTTLGIAIRAVSSLPNTAKLMGIKSEAIVPLCFAIAGGVAAVGGVLIAPITFASYTMTLSVGLKGFAAALIGGLGNTKGAFVGGCALGIIEALLVKIIPLDLKDAISFTIMIIVILLMPGGVLNIELFTKKTLSNKI